MIDLNDSRWKDFNGGYGIPYDASIALKKLEKADKVEAREILEELWNELHHQGDVGLASYFSVPHIIKIAKEKRLVDRSVLGLVTTIEIQRHKNNPKLPQEFEDAYQKALHGIKDLAELSLAREWNSDLASTTLSAIAIFKGKLRLAETILKLDEDVMSEILEKYAE